MSPTIERGAEAVELPDVRAGRLPRRYGRPMQEAFFARVEPHLREGVRILDVGAGRAPTIAPVDRPPGCRYVGNDIDAAEIVAAPAGAYDDVVVGDITRPLPTDERFDLVLCWQVLEHVDSMAGALRSMREVLVPGGRLVVQVTGSRALFAVAARAMPHRVRVAAMSRLLGSPPEMKFETRYDACTEKDLRALLAGWSDVEVTPFFRGATYLAFSRVLQRAYLAYENEIERGDRRSLATHYLVVAAR